jgi:hypothetical protein
MNPGERVLAECGDERVVAEVVWVWGKGTSALLRVPGAFAGHWQVLFLMRCVGDTHWVSVTTGAVVTLIAPVPVSVTATDTLPGYWMHETSGVLRPAVLAYLDGKALTGEHVAALRAYFRQWIGAPHWYGPDIEALREGVNALTSRTAIERWLSLALESGIDQL